MPTNASLTRLAVLAAVLAGALPARGESPRVTVIRTPRGGIQPQAVSARDGTIHLLYYKGSPGSGDLYYTRTTEGQFTVFRAPVRVNSEPGSAIATGTIRGGQIALGRGGRVHIAWNGSNAAKPANPIQGSPMLYARTDSFDMTFEPQRNLMTRTSGLDGGGSVAADAEGNVYVAWHGRAPDAPEGEPGRNLWVTRSSDDGATFAPEQPALARSRGACACCGTRSLADAKGNLFILYRAAVTPTDRDMVLLRSSDHGNHFDAQPLQPWRVAACPMSSAALADSLRGVFAAWETQGQVAFARLDDQGDRSAPTSPPGGGGDRKHPALAVNAAGETILVWAEGTGWQRGGTLAWRIFDPSGRPTREMGRVEGGIPVWSLPAVVARLGGGFTIIH
jgi:hypothetical protein